MARPQIPTDLDKGTTGRLELEIRALAGVIRTEWFIIVILLGIGIGLVMLHSTLRLQEYPRLIAISENIGLGIIVSAVVIFGFEWRTRARQMWDSPLTAQLIEQTRELKEVRDTLVSAKGHDSLEALLKLMLPMESAPKYRNELIEQILVLVDTMPRLTQVGIWAPHFIAELLKVVVVSNADRLSHLDGGGDHSFAMPPTGATVADMILAAQMETLDEGDSYEVISHLTAWKERQLNKLQEATRSASARGVRVKRIFNLSKENYTLKVEPDEARIYLKNHLRDTKELGPGKYEVKVFFPDDENRMSRYRNQMKRAHFGIFTRQGRKLMVDVTNENLASMKMSKKQDEFQPQSELFEAAWAVLDTDLSDDIIERVVSFYSTGHAPAERAGA